jgi:type I restriction enzyme, S subunit
MPIELPVPVGWSRVRLEDLGEVNRGRSRHRPRHEPRLYGGPYPFIQTGDIKASGGRITSFQQTYSEEGLAQSRLWPAGTMCITIAANIAETAILTFPACFPDSVIGFIADTSKCDVRFVEYVFRRLRRLIQHEVQDSGTVQDNINLGYLENLWFPVPQSVNAQSEIADVLSVIDDKIHLNRKMSHELELLASALFKSWFLDFDPVVAKRDGQRPVGVPCDAVDLFPDRFEDSDPGPIPEGWVPGQLGDRFEITMGQSPPGSTYNEVGEGLPFYQGRTDFEFRFPSRRVYCTAPTRLADAADTLVSVRAPVGDVNISSERCAIGRGIAAVRHKDKKPSFTYYAIRSLRDEFDVFESEGTLFGAIGGDDFRQIQFAHPPAPIAQAFEDLVAPLDALIDSNEHESRTLAELRDTLLGPLLSGELTVKTADKIAGVAL